MKSGKKINLAFISLIALINLIKTTKLHVIIEENAANMAGNQHLIMQCQVLINKNENKSFLCHLHFTLDTKILHTKSEKAKNVTMYVNKTLCISEINENIKFYSHVIKMNSPTRSFRSCVPRFRSISS